MLDVVGGLELRGRNIAERLEETAIVEPIDPFENGELDGFATPPRAATVDDLGLEQRVDGFGKRVVVRVAFATDRGLYARLGEPLGVPNR